MNRTRDTALDRIAVVAVDLDDTIVRSDKTVSPRTLDALLRWAETGGRLVIATGRPPRATEGVPEPLHRFPWIVYNGVEAIHNGRLLYQDLIPADQVRAITELLLRTIPDHRIGLEIDDVLYTNQDLGRFGVQHVTDLRAVANRPAAKILFSMDGEKSLQVLASLPPDVKPLVSRKYQLVQIMPRSASKGRALRHLVESWGLTMDQVMAFGDDVNDVDMLAMSGIGVAMGDAEPEVLAVADRITGTADEDGVAQVLEELMAGRP